MEPPSQNNTSGFTPVSASSTPTQQAETKQVRDVWNYNLEKEMNVITKFIDDEACTVAIVKKKTLQVLCACDHLYVSVLFLCVHY